jgi:Zn-dependent protease with chaperone function
MTAFAVAAFWLLCSALIVAAIYCMAAVQRRERDADAFEAELREWLGEDAA